MASSSIPPKGTSRGTVTHLLHTQVHTIKWDIQRNIYSPPTHPGTYHSVGHQEEQLLSCYTSRSIPYSGTSRGTVTHLLHIQVHTIQWDIQRNSYSPATHPGPFHQVGHPEEQLLTCYTSRSIPSSGTSRRTVTHPRHIQVHTIQWNI